MSYGIKIQNASGITNFDSSRLGRVVLDFFLSPTLTAGSSYTKSYTVPLGGSVELYCTPVGNWNPIFRTYFTISYVGTSLNITFNAAFNTNAFYVLVLLK